MALLQAVIFSFGVSQTKNLKGLVSNEVIL
jgi:hypothetical protein